MSFSLHASVATSVFWFFSPSGGGFTIFLPGNFHLQLHRPGLFSDSINRTVWGLEAGEARPWCVLYETKLRKTGEL